MKVDTNFAESRTQKAANREIFGGALGRKISESVLQSRKIVNICASKESG